MNRHRTKLLEPVLKAWAEGQPIQSRVVGLTKWDTHAGTHADFSDERYEWRVKPEPRKIWVNEYLDHHNRFRGSMVHLTRKSAENAAASLRVKTHELTLNDDEQ